MVIDTTVQFVDVDGMRAGLRAIVFRLKPRDGILLISGLTGMALAKSARD